MAVHRILFALMLTAFASSLPSAAAAGDSTDANSRVQIASFTERFCADCHFGEAAEAGLDLTALYIGDASSARRGVHFDRWLQVLDRVEQGRMPPAEAVVPDDEERQTFVDLLRGELVEWERQAQAREGRSALRRLNRSEYHNTLRDLLALPHLDVLEQLPPDGSAHGFNKSSAALDFSHVHVTRWLDAAEAALRAAVAPTRQKPVARTVRAEIKSVEGVRAACQGLYAQLKQGRAIPMVGTEFDETLSADRGDFTKRTAGGVEDPPPHFDGLAMFVHGESNLNMAIKPFRVAIPGMYKIRVRGFGVTNRLGEKVDTDRTETVGFYTDNRTLGFCDLPSYEPTTAEITVWLNAGDRIKPLVASSPYSVIRTGGQGTGAWKRHRGRGVAFQWFELEGPLYDTWPPESHRRLFGDLPLTTNPEPDEARRDGRRRSRDAMEPFTITSSHPRKDGERLIRAFAERAIRRPLTERDLEIPLGILREKLDEGEVLQEALISAYRAILCSPEVLLLRESVGPLDDYGVASRLSYFLWLSPPDSTLRQLASEGRLRDPVVLRKQVDRMLDDPRLDRMVRHFLDHWLDLKDIELTEPDANLYPEYNPLLLDSMLAETRAFFRLMIDENLSAQYLVDSDFGLINQRLAELYGIDGVQGNELRRVEWPAGSHRGGLLTQASVLKVTANGSTTSPVVRGAFVMETFLGQPPPPPPASVPAIEPDISGATTIREQLDKHRSVESCAACHRLIDPPGFALESFDVMGGFRERYRSVGEGELLDNLFTRGGKPAGVRVALPVDAAGQLPDGSEFSGIDDFRALLAARQSQLAENLVRQWVTYATGAPPGLAGAPQVEEIMSTIADEDYGLRSMIHAVVQSEMFRRK